MKIGTRSARQAALLLAAAACAVYGAACSKGSDRQPAADSSAPAPAASEKSTPRTPVAGLTTHDADAGRAGLLFVGTSLTAGLGLDPDSAYPMMIQRRVDSAGLPFEVTNAGVSGETSSGLLDRLDWILRGNFSVMVLETGANDGLRGIPTTTLKTNLETALDRIKAKRPDARVVLVQMEALPNLGPKYATDFHNVFPDVAKEKGLTLLPFLLTDVAGQHDLNQGDGVHPNNRGERIVADNVWKGLRPILESVAAARQTK